MMPNDSPTHWRQTPADDTQFLREDVNLWNQQRQALGGQHMNLVRVDLRDLDLHQADLSNMSIFHCDFSNSNLTNVNFAGASLAKSVFTRALLRDSCLNDTKISDCRFYQADLTGSSLKNASIVNSEFRRSVLRTADLTGTRCGADMEDADLRNANLTKASLRETAVLRARFDDVILNDTVLPNHLPGSIDMWLDLAIRADGVIRKQLFQYLQRQTNQLLRDSPRYEADNFLSAAFELAELFPEELASDGEHLAFDVRSQFVRYQDSERLNHVLNVSFNLMKLSKHSPEMTDLATAKRRFFLTCAKQSLAEGRFSEAEFLSQELEVCTRGTTELPIDVQNYLNDIQQHHQELWLKIEKNWNRSTRTQQ